MSCDHLRPCWPRRFGKTDNRKDAAVREVSQWLSDSEEMGAASLPG
jgi:hypothetical protein